MWRMAAVVLYAVCRPEGVKPATCNGQPTTLQASKHEEKGAYIQNVDISPKTAGPRLGAGGVEGIEFTERLQSRSIEGAEPKLCT